METRDGLLEFRINQIEYPHPKRKNKFIVVDVLEYRQCYKGIWSIWKEVPIPSNGKKDD